MYRESEAQTNPYSPEYFLAPGARPEILLLQSLKANEGLPINNREINMIGQARVKKELELNAFPMTDEACFIMRKKMMESQELRELSIREADIDDKFSKRLNELKEALYEKNETNEFLASQRVESVRQARMEDREVALQAIRKNRIKVLRRLARKRNEAEPMLSGTTGRDIINEYFDRGSTVYAPLKREGATVILSKTTSDVNSRTVPMNSLDVIAGVEDAVPGRLKTLNDDIFNPEKNYLSSTLPVGVSKGGGRAAKPRLTSSALRAERNTKLDIESMYDIIQTKKKKAATISPVARGESANTEAFSKLGKSKADVLTLDAELHTGERPQTETKSKPGTPKTPSRRSAGLSMLAGKPKGRPDTPDIASRTETENTGHSLKVAVIMLQKLIRGRAVQNSMYEGRHRQKEVIEEMRASDESLENDQEEAQQLLYMNQIKELRLKKVQEAMEQKVIGSLASNFLVFLEAEKERNGVIEDLVNAANEAIKERSRREAVEAGRRQKEGVPLIVPNGLNGNVNPGPLSGAVIGMGTDEAQDAPPSNNNEISSDLPEVVQASNSSNRDEVVAQGNQSEEVDKRIQWLY